MDFMRTAKQNPIISALTDMGVVFNDPENKEAGPEDIAFQAVFFMGPAGSGKSWVKSRRYLKYMRFKDIDPDEIKKTHPEYDPEEPFKVHEWSKEISNKQFQDIVESGSGDPVVVDGTGKRSEGIAKKMEMARKNGYRIFLVYVYVPFEISIYRNRNRARFVPENIILEQSEGVKKTFNTLKSKADKFKVVATSDKAELKKAQEDIEVYPVPQAQRPPRPGDADYGVAKAASVAFSKTKIARGLVKLAKEVLS